MTELTELESPQTPNREPVSWERFAALYCARQLSDAETLRGRLRAVAAHFNPEGFFLLECHQFDSSQLGQRTILPFGGKSTFKTVPTHPVSPRGLASDMGVVIAMLPVAALEESNGKG